MACRCKRNHGGHCNCSQSQNWQTLNCNNLKFTSSDNSVTIVRGENCTFDLTATGGGGGGTGSVTSVGLSMPAAFTVVGSPITSSGTLSVIANGSTSQYIRGDGTLATFPTSSGSVTSVALTVPDAFTVSGSPITTNGTLAISAIGTSSQYIRGDGTLAVFPTIPTIPTFSNGLTLSSGTVKLGGALTETTTLTGTNSTHKLVITGSVVDGALLDVTNSSTSGTTLGIRAINNSSGGYALWALGGTGTGLFVNGATGIRANSSNLGIAVTTTGNAVGISTASSYVALQSNTVADGKAFYFLTDDSQGGIVDYIGTISRFATNPITGFSGFGVGFNFELEATDGNQYITNQIASRWTNGTAASRTAEFLINGVNNGTTATTLTLAGNGRLTLPFYGDGVFTSGTATYALGVDSSGNIMEIPVSGSSGSVTSFSFSDGNGFDGTVNNATSTPSLSITTTLTANSVPFIGSGGAITENTGNFFWNNSTTTLHTSGLTINNEYTFPTTDGTANQVLVTDGNGVLTWQVNPVDTASFRVQFKPDDVGFPEVGDTSYDIGSTYALRDVVVFRNRVIQYEGDPSDGGTYITKSGSVITFSSALLADEIIQIIVL
jgi:hypothetical protein